MADRRLLGSLATNPDLDRWVSLTNEGRVTIRTGKAELGQGIRTALAAIAADELSVDPSRIEVHGAASGLAPNEWVTAGSGSIEQSGTAVRQACAHARRILLARAAAALDVTADALRVDDGRLTAPSGASTTYWDLVDEKGFDYRVEEPAETVPQTARRFVGHGLPRVDLPAKVRGEPVFVHDLRLPGMRHARVIRPSRPGAQLVELPAAPDGAEIVRNGGFVAVVADREAAVVAAAAAVAAEARWEGGESIDARAAGPSYLAGHVLATTAIVDGAAVDDPPGPPLEHAGTVVTARYSKPFHLHGAIGPSAAVALFEDGHLTIWSHSQGVEILRLAVAEVVGLATEAVTAIHVDGAGCYGHNGADDAGLDAALVAMALPGRPVSVKWTRADEHGWEPAAPAMTMDLIAGVGADGCIASWSYDVHTYAHGARPRPSGGSISGLLASWYLASPWTAPERRDGGGFHSGGHRNADPYYDVGRRRVVKHLVGPAPIRTSSTRRLWQHLRHRVLHG